MLTTVLDDQRDLKTKVFDLFKASPDLIPHVEEGLSKEEHRALVRRQLMVGGIALSQALSLSVSGAIQGRGYLSKTECTSNSVYCPI